jgi:hypothetical protein
MVRETYGFICYYHPKRSGIPFPSNPGKTCLLPFPGGKNFWKKIRETELFFSLRPVMWDIFLDMIPPSHGRDVGTNSSSLVLYSTRHGHMKPEMTRLSISVKPSYPSYS